MNENKIYVYILSYVYLNDPFPGAVIQSLMSQKEVPSKAFTHNMHATQTQ